MEDSLRGGFLHPLKTAVSQSQTGIPPSPSSRSGVKPLKNFQQAPLKHVQRRRPGRTLGPRVDRLTAPRQRPRPPSPSRTRPLPWPGSRPIWSLPPGARGGLGCAFLRAFFPGISASGRRQLCCRPGGTQTLNLESAGGELCAGRTGRTRLDTRLRARPRTSAVPGTAGARAFTLWGLPG